MTASRAVHLGFEVGTGKPVEIPLKHMAVTGQSQEAGKTTALEALIDRSNVRAVTFITKRGEGSFAGGRRLQPFFRERADWVFVASLIDATLGEKNKLLRAWLMKVCRNTHTLAEVQRNVTAAKKDARGFAESIYTEIEGYLELVVPQLAQLPPARGVEIGSGLNVMDLSAYSSELQALVIRSVLEHVYEHENDVITVIPEAWEFLPEGRGSPVKLAAETLIRKGAALRNYMWIDSQDLAGVWKLAVRACPVVLVGVQREANEIKRTLANIPAGVAKPSAADIATLELGQFFACWGRHTVRTYVQPAWMPEMHAKHVAVGIAQPFAKGSGGGIKNARPLRQSIQEDDVTKDEAARLTRENEDLKRQNAELLRRIEALERAGHGEEAAVHHGRHMGAAGADPPRESRVDRAADHAPAVSRDRSSAAFRPMDRDVSAQAPLGNQEALYQAFKARLLKEAPADLRLVVERPSLEVTVQRPTLTFEPHSLKWRIVRLLADGFFRDERKSPSQIRGALKRTGPDANTANIGRAMDDLVKAGVFTDEGSGYLAVPGIDVTVREE